MIGCAAMIAAVAFVFGLIGSLLVPDADLVARLTLAVMPAAITFVVALVLFARDRARFVGTVRAVHRALLSRDDIGDGEFSRHFGNVDPVLLSQIRRAVSRFFDVPIGKIHPTDNLRSDLRFDALEPGFHSFVVYHVLNARNVTPQPFTFNSGNLNDIGDLAEEIQRVLQRFESSKTEADDSESRE